MQDQGIRIDSKCYHCGNDCGSDSLLFQDKSFCCEGCKLVYEILDQNNLCTYYDLDEQAGIRPAESHSQDKYAYLDDQEIFSQLIQLEKDQKVHIRFHIPSIHCASCIWLLENLHKLQKGVLESRIDFPKKSLKVVFDKRELSLSILVARLAGIGYEPEIQLADLNKQKPQNKYRSWYKLGVAGFCFGNIMLFSLPEYFSGEEALESNFRDVFAYLNLLLALPVFFYSALDYYRSAWQALKQGMLNMDVPIVLGIFALFFYSAYEIIFLAEAGYMDSLAALIFLLLLGKAFQSKTFENISFERDYKSYFPVGIQKWMDGSFKSVPLQQVEAGDRLLIRHDEIIPADGQLLLGKGYVDYSFVTGESVPEVVASSERLYAGGRQKSGAIEMLVAKKPSQSYLTELWNNEIFQKEKQHSLDALSTKVSKYFTWVVLIIALTAFAYWSFFDMGLAVKALSTVLIIACPCALAMSTPFTLGNTLRIFGKNRFYLKNAASIENLAQIQHAVFDKTGTLTKPELAQVKFEGDSLSVSEEALLRGVLRQSTHPLSQRILSHIGADGKTTSCTEFEEITGKGLKASTGQSHILVGSPSLLALNDLSESGSSTRVHIAFNGHYKGYFEIIPAYRAGLAEMMSSMKKDMQLSVLSGDSDHERHLLRALLGNDADMHFRQSPQDKLDFLSQLETQGKKTLMVGDGLNDAGALQKSTIGLAVSDQSNQFAPACDGIIHGDELVRLPLYLRMARSSRNIIKASFGISFAYNVVGLSFAVTATLSPVIAAIIMPISSITVVLFTTMMTNYKALQMGLVLPQKEKESWK